MNYALIAIIFITALCLGSFLGLLIHRLPIILSKSWQKEAHECLGMALAEPKKYNLFKPRSHCNHCQGQLKKRDLVPILSYLLLKGGCRHCGEKLSFQLLLIELLTGLLLTAVFVHFGFNITGIAAAITLVFCLVLAFIDYNTRLLPDCLTISWLWLGLLWHLHSNPAGAILGASLGYLLPWCINQLFMRIRNRPGMGQGDFKCLAAIGAWGGIVAVLGAYFLGALLCLMISIPFLIKHNGSLQKTLPFGPFLCLTGWFFIIFPQGGVHLLRWLSSSGYS